MKKWILAAIACATIDLAVTGFALYEIYEIHQELIKVNNYLYD